MISATRRAARAASEAPGIEPPEGTAADVNRRPGAREHPGIPAGGFRSRLCATRIRAAARAVTAAAAAAGRC